MIFLQYTHLICIHRCGNMEVNNFIKCVSSVGENSHLPHTEASKSRDVALVFCFFRKKRRSFWGQVLRQEFKFVDLFDINIDTVSTSTSLFNNSSSFSFFIPTGFIREEVLLNFKHKKKLLRELPWKALQLNYLNYVFYKNCLIATPWKASKKFFSHQKALNCFRVCFKLRAKRKWN